MVKVDIFHVNFTLKMQQVILLMKDYKGLIFCGCAVLILLGIQQHVTGSNLPDPYVGAHMLKADTIPPLKDRISNYLQSGIKNPFDLKGPQKC